MQGYLSLAFKILIRILIQAPYPAQQVLIQEQMLHPEPHVQDAL